MKPTTTSLLGSESMQTTSSHETRKLSNPFTWAKVHARVVKLRERLPEAWRDLIPVETVKDTKIVVALMTVFFALFLPFIVALPILVKLAVTSYSWTDSIREGGEK